MQESLHFTDKGLKPLTKLVLLGMLALALLLADTRFAVMQQARAYLLAVTAPIQRLLQMPMKGVTDGREFITYQSTLVANNKKLSEQNALLSGQLTQAHALAQENEQLKKLLKLSQNNISFVSAAQVIATGRDPLSDRLIIDKGSADGLVAGQAVVDAQGLIGQVTAVSARNAQVMLLNYQNSVIPVMVARTGFRTLLYGDSHRLDLRYFPAGADLQVGDVLVTSGIDANFPAGIPVARVTRLESAAGTPYYRAQTQALGNTDAVQYVLVMPKNREHDLSGLPGSTPAAGETP